MGASDVAVEARHPHQEQARERIGATTPGQGYDVVVETAGSESGLHGAVELARPEGTVVYVGVYGDITWPHHTAFMKVHERGGPPAITRLLRPPRAP
jgi:threonine dehydrogenase-like Zn-dependent dehydrogenase